MSLIRKNGKKIVVLLVLLVVLTGCTKITDSNGITLPEKIIYSTTTFKEMFQNENWFTAVFVYPIAWLINFLSDKVGAFFGLVLATITVNLITLPLTIKSTAGQQKLQMVQPEIEAIQKKYEGRDDQDAKIRAASEMNAVYKKYDVNPISSLLGIFVTFPLLIAMYQAAQRAYAICTGSFLGYDLRMSIREGFLAGGKYLVIAIVLEVLLIGFQFLSMMIPRWIATSKNKKYQNAGMDDQQKLTNASMCMVIGLMGISMPTSISLYWIISSIVNTIKTVIIQKAVVDKE